MEGIKSGRARPTQNDLVQVRVDSNFWKVWGANGPPSPPILTALFTFGWPNQFHNSDFHKKEWKYKNNALFRVNLSNLTMVKEKAPYVIPPGGFCESGDKQNPPSAVF